MSLLISLSFADRVYTNPLVTQVHEVIDLLLEYITFISGNLCLFSTDLNVLDWEGGVVNKGGTVVRRQRG